MVHLPPPILVVASPLLRYMCSTPAMCTDSSGHIVAGAVSSLAAPAASSCAVRIAAHGDDHPIPVVGLEAEQVVLQAAHKKI